MKVIVATLLMLMTMGTLAHGQDVETIRSPQDRLDQGGETCASARVIQSLPFSDSGTLGASNDCSGSPYRDLFYTYVAQAAGAHTFDMCGTATGDTRMRVWMQGICCGGLYLSGDNECATNAPRVTVAMAVGERAYIECGSASSSSPAHEYVFHASGPDPFLPGDHCSNALDYPGIPSTVTGNTCGYLDDFNASCDWIRFGAKDVVYRYRPRFDEQVTFHLCQSNFDTKLYVFDGTCQGTPIACNDVTPGCGPNETGARLDCLPLVAGHTYYIVVDGWDVNACGDYVLISEPCVPCNVVCPPNGQPEGEPPCYEGYVDQYNGGCWADLEVFQPIACGDVICGEFGSPDLDWFELLVPGETNEPTLVHWCVKADYPPEIWIFNPPCQGTIVETDLAGACDTVCISLCLPAATYYLMIQPWHFGGVACGTPYVAWIECEPCGPQFSCECADHENTHCNLASGLIPDMDDVEIDITVPVQYHITDVNVCLDITHPFDADLEITLTSPVGTTVPLCLNRGGGADDFTCTLFDDEAAVPIGAGVAPFTGTYRPESPLSALDGENALGAWTLRVLDESLGETGYVNGVCLEFEYDCILAIELIHFAAIEGIGLVTLEWQTASETDNSHFEVFRDEEHAARVPATNSPSGSRYAWTDRDLQNGTSYVYRLTAVDMQGSTTELGSLTATPHAAVASEFACYQNQPNPFNSSTLILYDLAETDHVEIVILNTLGQTVATLVKETQEYGPHAVAWDGRTATGTMASAGVYLYQIRTTDHVATRKMVLLR